MAGTEQEAPLTEINDPADADALILGVSLLSTGGGGWPERGKKYLRQLLTEGYTIRWVPVESLPPDSLVCSVFGMGSTAPHPPMSDEEMARFGVLGERYRRPGVRALEELGKLLSEPVSAVVAFELGGFNTAVGIDAAMRAGVTLVDGDLCGRSVPEMSQALPAALGHNPWPLTICDQWGNSLVLQDCPSAMVAERIGKMVSTVSKKPNTLATCAHAAFPMLAQDLSGRMIVGTLSEALAIGRRVATARTDNEGDVSSVAAEAMGGELLFEGVVYAREWIDDEGYQVGTTTIDGTGPFGGEVGRVWFKNENHVLWRGSSVLATSPDLISVVLKSDASPRTNTELQEGDVVSVLVRPAPFAYQAGVPLELMEPRHYGFDFGYSPRRTS